MSAAVRLPVLQGSPEWLAARRELITATDIGARNGVIHVIDTVLLPG